MLISDTLACVLQGKHWYLQIHIVRIKYEKNEYPLKKNFKCLLRSNSKKKI
jgi:hypothetical protein